MKLILASFLTLAFIGPIAQADDKMKTKMPKMEWTAVQRENMAKAHETMATCLRTNKSVSECRAEMKTSCKDMGKDACPMHEKDGMM